MRRIWSDGPSRWESGKSGNPLHNWFRQICVLHGIRSGRDLARGAKEVRFLRGVKTNVSADPLQVGYDDMILPRH